jgi:CubicO group peptidase (beta-lactamase class C family)
MQLPGLKYHALRVGTRGLLGGLLFPGLLAAQAPAGWQEFEGELRAYADSDQVVGASAVLVQGGQVVARTELGYADRATGRRVDAQTIFHWGSITKTLTAIGIMQLRDRARLSLDDRVVRYVPELRRVHDPYGKIDSITIRMLLSHTAGFQDPTWPYRGGHEWEPFEPTTWQQLVAMMPYQQLHFEPGSRYRYSNPAFIYLAQIIEQLTGDPWDSYVQKNIFAPLGLERSYFRGTPYYLAAHRSHNYYVLRDSAGGMQRVDNGADFDPGITTPNGGWNAPLDDLVRYVAFLTDSGSRENYEFVLSRASLAEMWQPVAAADNPLPGSAMGLSFFLTGADAGRLIGHTGQQAGFRSWLFFNPRTSTAIIVAFNTTNEASPASRERSQRLLEAALALLR